MSRRDKFRKLSRSLGIKKWLEFACQANSSCIALLALVCSSPLVSSFAIGYSPFDDGRIKICRDILVNLGLNFSVTGDRS
jgi:hypothetical protein